MAKRLVAKTGEYQNANGETKGEYTRIGVILSNDNGEYVLIDPSVNLAGILLKQNILAGSQGKKIRDNVMASVFTDDDRQRGGSQGGQGGYQSGSEGGYGGSQGQEPRPALDDSEIPF